IGAGLAGAAAAYSLTARGEDVTVVERHTPANDRGSSHGSARIFRYAYPDRLYTELVVRSRGLWDALEAESGTELITRTGAIDHGDARHVSQLAEIFEAVGVAHEIVDPARAAERWPQFTFDTEVLWHPDAGVIDAETTVTSMLVAAGGWLPDLLGDLGLPDGFLGALPRFEVRQEQAFHMPYRDTDEDGRPATAWPTFIHKSDEMFTYGLPGGRDAGFAGQKLAQF